jgi:hypothetical protein
MLIAATAATLLTVTPAFAADTPQTFARNGVTYFFTVAEKGGSQRIKGYSSDNSTFDLSIRGTRVTGTVRGRSVSFRTSEVERTPIVEVAQR